MGVAMGFGFVVAIQSVLAWFDRRRALGVGIAVAGSGLGNFALAPTAQVGILTIYMRMIADCKISIRQALVDEWGWRGALRVFAGLTLIVSLMCAAFVRRREARHLSSGAAEDSAQRALFKKHLASRPFVFMFVSALLTSFGYFIPFLFLKPYAVSIDVTETQAVWLVSGLGIFSTVGRIGMGVLADYAGRMLLLRVSYLAMAIAAFALAFMQSLALLWIFVAVYGCMAGAFSMCKVVCCCVLVLD
jgi:predicted MFS family arabinose efflux permease